MRDAFGQPPAVVPAQGSTEIVSSHVRDARRLISALLTSSAPEVGSSLQDKGTEAQGDARHVGSCPERGYWTWGLEAGASGSQTPGSITCAASLGSGEGRPVRRWASRRVRARKRGHYWV